MYSIATRVNKKIWYILKKSQKTYKLLYLNSKCTNKNPCESTRHLINYINVANYIIFIIISLLSWNIKYYIIKVKVDVGFILFVLFPIFKDKACGFLLNLCFLIRFEV